MQYFKWCCSSEGNNTCFLLYEIIFVYLDLITASTRTSCCITIIIITTTAIHADSCDAHNDARCACSSKIRTPWMRCTCPTAVR